MSLKNGDTVVLKSGGQATYVGKQFDAVSNRDVHVVTVPCSERHDVCDNGQRELKAEEIAGKLVPAMRR